MITPFYGEFLVNPVPLELDLNYCTHQCAYCFANLNKPERTANLTGILNLLRDFPKRRTLEAQLLQHRYPILFSNKVDPFASSNHSQSLPILRLLRDLRIPVALQTKGPRTSAARDTLDQALELITVPSSWYVSIATLDESVAKRIEPGAPTIADRLTLIARLIAMGHKVSVGLNPLVPEWCPDPAELLRTVHALGVRSVWVESLHLSSSQTRNLSTREKDHLTPALIKRAGTRGIHDLDYTLYLSALQSARDLGMNAQSVNGNLPSNYFDTFTECYSGKAFPTWQGFINWCHTHKQLGDLIYFREFWSYCQPHLPELVSAGLYHYIGAIAARTIGKTHLLPKDMTWQQVCAVYWDDIRLRLGPHRSWAMEKHLLTDSEGVYHKLDDTALPIYRWTGLDFPTAAERRQIGKNPRPIDMPALA